MDFFAQQDRARTKTKWLIAYFALAILGIILAIYAAVMIVVNYYHKYPSPLIWSPNIFFWVSVTAIFVITIGTVYKLIELRQGGQLIASMMGGRPVNLHTTHPGERMLLNVVEEMSIASGTPMPTVYILPEENGINAFAAGRDSHDAVIAVTRGCIELLTRDELQGVIGHEFSHILNGDMNLNVRLMGLLNGILLIALIGRSVFRIRFSSSSNKKGGGGILVIFAMGLALIIIGYIGVFFANLIKAAVSRQREFLADASSVQFTRNPGGIVGALKKIGRGGSRISDINAEQASHLFFADGIDHLFTKLLSTHPPLDERIRAIDPNFDGNFPIIHTPESLKKAAAERNSLDEALSLSSGYVKKTPAEFVDSTGNLNAEHIYYAQALTAAIPDDLRKLSRDPHSARAILLALLLSKEESVHSQQLSLLSASGDESLLKEMEKIAPLVEPLPKQLAIPLIDLMTPALRQLSADQYDKFTAQVDQLIAADQSIDLFEYTLRKILFRHLDIYFGKAKSPKVAYRTMQEILPEVVILLSALANLHDDPAISANSFKAGADNLEIIPRPEHLLSHSECDLASVDAALDKLAAAAPSLKKNLLLSCAFTVTHDQKVDLDEWELLRAIADSLDCPLPPIASPSAQSHIS